MSVIEARAALHGQSFRNEITIKCAALDEKELPVRGLSIVLRGALDAEALRQLKTDDYQREAEENMELVSAVIAGARLPDIVLGMRGEMFRSSGDTFYLQDPVFIIDGLQRTYNTLRAAALRPDLDITLGAMLHFATTREWEMTEFEVLNGKRKAVAPSKRLANHREKSPVLGCLYGVTTNDDSCALNGRVCWQQRSGKNHLVTATTIVRVVIELHSHFVPRAYAGIPQQLQTLELLGERVGLELLRKNLKHYLDFIDSIWGLRKLSVSGRFDQIRPPQSRQGFLASLARVFSSHIDFWRNDYRELLIPAPLRRKIGSFDLRDPEIDHLCSAAGISRDMLTRLLIDHINRGKREKRLTAMPAEALPKGSRRK